MSIRDLLGGHGSREGEAVSTKPRDETGTTPAAAAPSGDKPPSGRAREGKDTSLDGQTEEQLEAQRRALETAPAEIQAQADRLGGQVPRAAPKAGEGQNPDATKSAFPELEPPVPPTEFRAAPVAPGEEEREAWPASDRPNLAALEAADEVEVRTTDPKSAPFYVAGVRVDRFGVKAKLAPIIARGRSHVAMLAEDPRVEVRLVTARSTSRQTEQQSASKSSASSSSSAHKSIESK